MSDMTIKAVRTTFLRVPWPNDPWLKGPVSYTHLTLPTILRV